MSDEVDDAALVGATVIEVDQHRWYVNIKLRLADGREQTMVASADSYLTDSNNVWWGTAEEHEEAHQ